ncbi:MAG TPA: sigma-54 dependent transcriptional regulator [Candidatus Acidoferrales bacterium]|nr:sigma-54 dependent transcriptional regulator [Candidatus Acidoferrales bacterium]
MSQVLVVDDESSMCRALDANFRRRGWQVTTANGVADALAKFRTSPCRLVVTDMRMSDGDGLDVLQGVRHVAPHTAVIFLTAYGSVPEAVTAMREGACDYLMKPVSFEQLEETAQRILGRASDEVEPDFFIGESLDFRHLVARAKHIAQTDADILIEAESGTGKELLARLIHRASPRSSRPFVAVNCAAFPENLLESELFGHVRGAFTGALAAKPGKFQIADGGTLLLDEIGEMPLSLQPKLLRVLQEREVDRLGDTRPVPIDVRVISTTNRSLASQIEAGVFRSDLFYRLNVIPLSIPPLRERREDILSLAEHFLRKLEPISKRGQFRISPELAVALRAHDWPGNIRELANFIRRGVALTQGATLGVELFGSVTRAQPSVSDRPKPGTTLEDIERQLLEATLEATNGNRTRTAEMMGVSLRTVRNKIREYGLRKEAV